MAKQEVFFLAHFFHCKKHQGLSLIEAIIVILIFSIISASLIAALRVGDISNSIGSLKTDLYSDTRMLLDWLTSDVRQGKIQKIYAYNPTTDYLKIPLWVWNDTNLTQKLTGQYIEYKYDNKTYTLTRRLLNNTTVINEINFTNVLMPPFYTSYTNESKNDFNSSTLLTSRKIIIAIKRGKNERNRPLNFTMVEEVRIRNE
ncbi:MAG: prepilin-type N-terminal cleavage/methylation domain-containing protein [Candidatus Omnitrophica bacterium]|nr:prepilin-type N-terminal cleavage/methylation domain-containing protein [Candidatus Omnitrophota bacterium]